MPRSRRNTLAFDSPAGAPRSAVVLIADLRGFSAFLNIPGAPAHAAHFLNHVFRALNICLTGGTAYWVPEAERARRHRTPLPRPAQVKFLGDGAMYIWVRDNRTRFNSRFLTALANRLWNLQAFFPDVLRAIEDDIPIPDLPEALRIGLAGGEVYELRRSNGGDKEYIGTCINLASRLQKYCPSLAFIASARTGIPAEHLRGSGYKRVVAKAVRGFPRESVWVDSDEYDAMPWKERRKYFR